MRTLLKDVLLALRSRRVLMSVGLALIAAIAIWILVPPEQQLLGYIVLAAAAGIAVIIGGLALALSGSTATSSFREHGQRIMQLAAQLQAGDANVARLAARLERIAGQIGSDASGSLARALDQVSGRLNALEHTVASTQAGADVAGIGEIQAAVRSFATRLDALEQEGVAVRGHIDRSAQDDSLGRLRSAVDLIVTRLNTLENETQTIRYEVYRADPHAQAEQVKTWLNVVAGRLNAAETALSQLQLDAEIAKQLESQRPVLSAGHLASTQTQLEAVTNRLAQIEARVESEEERSRLEALAARLTEVELRAQHEKEERARVEALASRLQQLEGADDSRLVDLRREVESLRARLVLAEEQMTTHAANVEQFVRRQPKKA